MIEVRGTTRLNEQRTENQSRRVSRDVPRSSYVVPTGLCSYTHLLFYRYVAPNGADTRLLNSLRFVSGIHYNSCIVFKAIQNSQKIDNNLAPLGAAYR